MVIGPHFEMQNHQKKRLFLMQSRKNTYLTTKLLKICCEKRKQTKKSMYVSMYVKVTLFLSLSNDTLPTP